MNDIVITVGEPEGELEADAYLTWIKAEIEIVLSASAATGF